MKTMKKIYRQGRSRSIAVALTCGLTTLTLKAQDIYVANWNGTIGVYGMDGSTVNASLISGVGLPSGIAISGNDLFVANGGIGEYTTSGQIVNASLISADISALAISGNDMFVVDDGNGTIGEYGLDGSTVNASLISGLSGITGIAISGDDLFISNEGNGIIGEYTTSGATVNASLISGINSPKGIAISGNNIFVATYYGQTFEYTTSGTQVNPPIQASVNGYGYGVATSGNDVFFTADSGLLNNGSVVEFTTSLTPVSFSLVTGLYEPTGIAIGPAPVPEPSAIALACLGAIALIARGAATLRRRSTWQRRKLMVERQPRQWPVALRENFTHYAWISRMLLRLRLSFSQ